MLAHKIGSCWNFLEVISNVYGNSHNTMFSCQAFSLCNLFFISTYFYNLLS